MMAHKSISALVYQEIPELVSKFAPLLEGFHCQQMRFVRNFVFTSAANFTKTAKQMRTTLIPQMESNSTQEFLNLCKVANLFLLDKQRI